MSFALTQLPLNAREASFSDLEPENMPNLRRLSAARNNLFLSTANQLVLSALGKLEILNLNDNFLGG